MMDFISSFLDGMANTGTIEYVAVAAGLLSVYFILKQNILGYPAGLLNVGLYVYLCFQAGLFANMGINIFFFVISIYGWYNWARKGNQQEVVKVTKLNSRQRLLALAAVLLFFFLLREILVRFPGSSSPVFDALTTAIFIVAMWLQAKKKLESWLFWIAGDVMAVPLYALTGLAFTGLQYFAFLFLAISGYFAWKKSLSAND